MRENIKDQCQAVIEIIKGGCVWYERGKDGKNVVCKLCKENMTVLKKKIIFLYHVQE